VFASSVPVFLPCPFSDFSSFPLLLGDGGFVALSVSCVMEWNISLAIFLATKRVLCLEAIFSRFLAAGKCWMEEDHSHFCSVHRPSSISAQLRRTRVCCCYRAGLLGRGPLGWEWYVDPGSTALGFIYLGSCAATELGTLACSLTWFRAESSGRHVILQRTLQLDCQIGGGREQLLVCSFSHSLQR